MTISSSIRWTARFLAVWLLSACTQEELSPSGPEESPPPLAESGKGETPFDVQKVMDQVHFAFRAEGSAWEGAHSTYAVRVEAGGFSVTPYHFPREEPEAAASSRSAQAQPDVRKEPPGSVKSVEGAPVRFGAARVTRGRTVMATQKPEGQVKESGGLTLTRGIVAEHFRNSRDGVEQSWSFEQRLEGTGALEVRVPVRSGRFLGETAQGLHFADGTTGLGVRYGHGTWVDAEGNKTPVPARFEAGAIVLSVPADVVDASSYPAVLDPTVSPELGMDNPVNGPADKGQHVPATTYNGTNFLVVWQDFRSGSYDIYGARVSGTGTVLDTSGIRISAAISSQYGPQVEHDGTNFLVVWYDARNGAYDIYGARVSNTGVVLDTNGIPISTATSDQFAPVVAYDGTNFLVAWQDYRSGTSYDIYGARVSTAGTVLDLSGIPISTAANSQQAPSIAYNGTNFLIAWQDTRSGTGFYDIYGTRVSAAGTVLNVNGILISGAINHQQYPAVAYNGSDFVVAWQDNRSGTSYDIYAARVSATGVVRNPSGIPIFTAASDQLYPAVARAGTTCLIVWQDYRSYDIYGARLDNTGVVLDTSSILISTLASSAYYPALAYDGTNFLIVWEDYTAINSSNIHGARVSSMGTIVASGDFPVSLSANGQYTPAVAHDGTNFLAVWQDYRAGRTDIYGTLISETGVVLNTSGIAISTSNTSKYNPTLAHDGLNFLVVWSEYRGTTGEDIYGARVSSGGAVLDTAGISISAAANTQTRPAVVHNGVNFLVVWQDYRSASTSDIYGARVNSSGTLLDTTGIAISTAASDQYFPVVAQNGADFLVAWQDYRSGSSDIYGARVNSGGVLLDTTGIAISTAVSYQYTPAVAYNGLHFLVVWQDYRSGSADIYGARVTGAGTVLDTSGIAISAATSSQSSPAVAYDGANFFVVWQDDRSGTGFADIYGARVSETGTILETSGLAIAAGPANELTPKITAMGGESSLVVYRGSHSSSATNSERVLARLVQFP